jgi:hypothetical protein
MVRTRLLDRLGLGAVGEVRIRETLCEGVALLFGGGGTFGQARFLRFEINHPFDFERNDAMRERHLNIGA